MSRRDDNAPDDERESERRQRSDRRVLPMEPASLDHLDLDRRRGRVRSTLGRKRYRRTDGRQREGQRGESAQATEFDLLPFLSQPPYAADARTVGDRGCDAVKRSRDGAKNR